MLSIIVSSYNENYFSQFKKSIAATIGNDFSFEIIQQKNYGEISLSKAYNLAASKAKYPYLLFCHEDIILHTMNWGSILIEHLSDNNTGIIGVAGSSYVPVAPSSWPVDIKYNHFNILQGNKENTGNIYLNSALKNKIKSFALDGVFLAMQSKIFKQFGFNEQIEGYHGYDLEISLRYSETLNNFIINDITIEHFSPGNMDEKWFDNNIIIREKFKNSTFQKSHDSVTETKAFEIFLRDYMKYKGISLQTVLRTFRFFPTKRIKYSDKLKLLKLIYMHLRYKKEFEKKYKILNA